MHMDDLPPPVNAVLPYLFAELDPGERHELARRLANDPDEAQALCADLERIEGLRAALGSLDAGDDPRLGRQAARLNARLARARWGRQAKPWFAASALIAVGWLAHWIVDGLSGKPENGLAQGILAQGTLGETLWQSGPNAPTTDNLRQASELVGVRVPDLPEHWRVLAASPLRLGEQPALALHLATPELGEVILMIAAGDDDALPAAPAPHVQGASASAAFEVADMAYVLVDPWGNPDDVTAQARLLERRFR